MAESEDKVLLCRQCGKEFHFTEAEQEFYIQKGWAQPSHCPQCRSARRSRGLRLVCSGCGILMEREDSIYCSNCVDNLKLEAELEHHGQQERIKKLEGRLESLGELEQRLASVTMELEKTQQANKELQDRMATAHEAASWDSLKDPLQHLVEQFGAFKQSYTCDIDNLTGLLLEIQYALTQKREAGPWHRLRIAFARKTGRPEAASRKAHNFNGLSTQGCPENTPLPKNKDTTTI